MKNILLGLVCCIGLVGQVQGQTEVKISPVPLLFGAGLVSVEYGLQESWGLEADGLVAAGAYALIFSGKYYFNPQFGLDRFHIGMFLGGYGGDGSAGAGIGFLLGHKWVSAKNVVFELGLGAGRGFSDDIPVVPYAKFHVGYRFR